MHLVNSKVCHLRLMKSQCHCFRGLWCSCKIEPGTSWKSIRPGNSPFHTIIRALDNFTPTPAALKQHIKHACYMDNIWKQSLVSEPELPNPSDWGRTHLSGSLSGPTYQKQQNTVLQEGMHHMLQVYKGSTYVHNIVLLLSRLLIHYNPSSCKMPKENQNV